MSGFSVPTLVNLLVELRASVGSEKLIGVGEPEARLELVPIVSVVESVIPSIAVTADPGWPVAITDVIPALLLWLLLSVNNSVFCIEGGLDADKPCSVAILCVDVNETTTSADAVVMDPSVALTEIEAVVGSCAVRVDSVIVVPGEVDEPPSAYVEECPVVIIKEVAVTGDVESVEVATVAGKLLVLVGLAALDGVVVKPSFVDSVLLPVVSIVELLWSLDVVDVIGAVEVSSSALVVDIVEVASVDDSSAGVVVEVSHSPAEIYFCEKAK